LDQLSQHKLHMKNSDSPNDTTQHERLFSLKNSESSVSIWCMKPAPTNPFPSSHEERLLQIPGGRSKLGRKLRNWIIVQGL
ncbi:transcriptional activator NhaR, partial [Klebsiella pneumoniae]|nr:transcriptional activator NhaR [Klebsiella pneumoniae]